MKTIRIKGYVINYKEVDSKYDVIVYDNIGEVGSFTIDKESFFKKIEIINSMNYYQIRNYIYTLEGGHKDHLKYDCEEELNLLKSPLDLKDTELFEQFTNDKLKDDMDLFVNSPYLKVGAYSLLPQGESNIRLIDFNPINRCSCPLKRTRCLLADRLPHFCNLLRKFWYL